MSKLGPWGAWSLDPETGALMHDGGPYGIEVAALCDNLGFWLDHIGGKGWGTRQVLLDLLDAYEDLRPERAA